jgi:hypothetical protein
MKRRGFLGGVAVVAAAPQVRPSGPPSDLTKVAPERRALAATRIINTLENAHFKKSGSYLPFTQIMQSELAERILKKSPVINTDAAFRGDDPIAGFSVSLDLATGDRDYTLLISERSSGFALQSDRSGVIKKGILQPIGSAFVGEAIQAPGILQPETGAKGLARQLMSFLFPVAHAQASCCDQLCIGYCIGPYGCSQCVGLCCDLGYAGCTWCCSAATDCSCAIWLC